jgi:phage repressor protein C with HTH and peptisase S24 domain
MKEEPRDRLRNAREKAGYDTPADFAARNADKINESTYRSHENGTRPLTMRSAELYGPLLKVSPKWLLYGSDTDDKGLIKSAVTHSQTKVSQIPPAALSREKIKVLGMAECGPDGWALWNGDVVDLVDRPASLIGVKKAYAVYIQGVSMEPRYFPGEVAFIHPGKPIQPGSFVLVQLHPPEGESTPRAFIKRLVKRSGDKIIFEQYNPPRSFTLKASEILSIHRVVQGGEP